MIVNARMYAVATPVAQAWRALFALAGTRAAVDWSWVDHAAPAPVNALWARPDCGCVFMCGLPYISSPVRKRLLAAPVPALPRYGDRPVYYTEFIVRADAPFDTLGLSFGTRLACMLEESNSGYNAPRHHLLRLAPAGAQALYRPTAAPTPTPRQVIDAVLGGTAEVGVVDSYVLDLLRLHEPQLMSGLRTLDVTQASPIPPLVASPELDVALAERVGAALQSLHLDAAAAPLLQQLQLARFAPVAEADYAVLAERRREADSRGFALTASTL